MGARAAMSAPTTKIVRSPVALTMRPPLGRDRKRSRSWIDGPSHQKRTEAEGRTIGRFRTGIAPMRCEGRSTLGWWLNRTLVGGGPAPEGTSIAGRAAARLDGGGIGPGGRRRLTIGLPTASEPTSQPNRGDTRRREGGTTRLRPPFPPRAQPNRRFMRRGGECANSDPHRSGNGQGAGRACRQSHQ
jgi:hypothetical protein